MRKRANIKPIITHQHLWLPLCTYHTADGTEYTKYQCKFCNEIIDKEVTNDDSGK